MLHLQSPPLSGIVTAFDVVKDIRSRLGSRPIVLPVDPLPFEQPEEALSRRIGGMGIRIYNDQTCSGQEVHGGKKVVSVRIALPFQTLCHIMARADNVCEPIAAVAVETRLAITARVPLWGGLERHGTHHPIAGPALRPIHHLTACRSLAVDRRDPNRVRSIS